jgi:hypothetical protein
MNQIEYLVSKSIDVRFAEFIQAKGAWIVGDQIVYPAGTRDIATLEKSVSGWFKTEAMIEQKIYELEMKMEKKRERMG